MRKMETTCLVMVMLSSAVFAQAPDLSQMDIVQRSVPDGPVAKVGDVNITKTDFLLLYQSERQRSQMKSMPDVARVQLGLMVLRSLIEHELLYQEAENRNIKVADSDVDSSLQSRLNRLREGFSSKEGREITEEELLELLGYVDKSDLRDNVHRLLMVESMRTKIIKEDGLRIDDARVKQIYAETKDRFTRPGTLHLKQIFISAEGDGQAVQENALKKAERALNSVFSGQRFEAVAKQYSESPDAAQGGDLGHVPEKDLPPFLVAAVEGLKPGDVSDVVKSDYGCHIVMLVERIDGLSATEEQAHKAIHNKLLEEQEKTAVYSYCDELISNGFHVEVYLELEENLRRLGKADVLKTY